MTAPERQEKLPAKPKKQLLEFIGSFEEEHAELLKAMQVFGVTNAEYERAMRALYGASISTVSSTDPAA